MLPESAPIKFWNPTTTELTDDYGRVLTLARNLEAGNVLKLTAEYNDDGEEEVVSLSGNFHGPNRQNSVNLLQQWRGSKERSQQENQQLLFICPHPAISFRCYLRNLKIDWDPKLPLFFSFSFDLTRSPLIRQPDLMLPFQLLERFEGKDYLVVEVKAGYTSLRAFAQAYYNRNFIDSSEITEIIRLNELAPEDTRNIVVGQLLKMPTGGRGKVRAA